MIDEIQGPPALGGAGRAAAPDLVPRARRAAGVPVSRRVGAHRGAAGAVRRGRAARDRADAAGARPVRPAWSREADVLRRRAARRRPRGVGGGTCRRPSTGWRSTGWRSSPTARPVRPRRDAGERVRAGGHGLRSCAEPIVYEDFLPRSAAGIFRSNLAGEGTRDEGRTAPEYDLALAGRGPRRRPCTTPWTSTPRSSDASLRAAAQELGVRIVPGRPDEHDLSRSPTS